MDVSRVSDALRDAHAPYYIVICGLSASTIFFPHYRIKGMSFEKKVIEIKMRVLIFSVAFFLHHFSFYEDLGEISLMYIGFHVKCPLFLSEYN